MLWAAAMERGYSCPLWLTYRQAAELGGQVRKGEKGSLVVYADKITKTGTDDKGADIEIEDHDHVYPSRCCIARAVVVSTDAARGRRTTR
jgi:antirestriction protein ArdC